MSPLRIVRGRIGRQVSLRCRCLSAQFVPVGGRFRGHYKQPAILISPGCHFKEMVTPSDFEGFCHFTSSTTLRSASFITARSCASFAPRQSPVFLSALIH